jgi:DNA (cytosine-5)-methyltransferase 1
MPKNQKPAAAKVRSTFIDLCCGCGGFSRGLIGAGLDLVQGYDIDETAIKTFNLNFPKNGTVSDITRLHLPVGAAEILVSGLPCQGYSTLGKREEHDPRNALWKSFLRLVWEAHPVAGAVENVPLFLKSEEFRKLQEGLEVFGYTVTSGVISAADFGVAQRRERALILFARGATPVIPSGASDVATVRRAWTGLPRVPDGRNDHLPRSHDRQSLRRFRHIPEGGTRKHLPKELQSPCWKRTKTGATNSFGRLWWNKPADTLRTVFLKPETGRFIHPSEDRGLTVREGARLQGFADTFKFSGSMDAKAEQIGNAVPPPVARAVGKELKRVVAAALELESDAESAA